MQVPYEPYTNLNDGETKRNGALNSLFSRLEKQR